MNLLFSALSINLYVPDKRFCRKTMFHCPAVFIRQEVSTFDNDILPHLTVLKNLRNLIPQPSKCLSTSKYFPQRKKAKKKSRKPKKKEKNDGTYIFIIFAGFPIENETSINADE